MAMSTGLGVAAVGLPTFPTTGDPRKNCERFIQKFRDWCELNGWYNSEPPAPEEEGGQPGPLWPHKGKAMAAFRSAIATNENIENLVLGLQLAEGERSDPEAVLKRLQEHFSGSEGVLYERTKFAQLKQESHETVTAWEGRVRLQGKRLEYCATCEDQLLRDKFISGVSNERLLLKLLDKGHRDKVTKEVVPLRTMVQIAKNFEQCEQAKTLMQQTKAPVENVNFTGQGNPPKQLWQHQRRQQNDSGHSVKCQFCAGPVHPRTECPARDKQCRKKGCGRMGHFARACRMGAPLSERPPRPTGGRPQAHQLDADTSFYNAPEESDPFLFSVDIKPEKYAHSVYNTAQEQPNARGRKFFSHVKLCLANTFRSVRVQLDTASTCNTLPHSVAQKLVPKGMLLTDYLQPSRAALYTYNNSKIVPMGKLELLADSTTGYHLLTFHVLKDSSVKDKPPLLSGTDCLKLGLVTMQADEVHAVEPLDNLATSYDQLQHGSAPARKAAPVHLPEPPMFDVTTATPPPGPAQRPDRLTLPWVLESFPDLHKGLGQFGRPVHFDLDPVVSPIHDTIHRQPVARHTQIKAELDKMEKEGKICRQYEPTAWCSNMTVRETKDKFRICLDPSNTINKAIRVPKHPIPRFEDILPQLTGAKCFSVADALSGFTNIPLDHESSLATTFHTPFGRYRWLRLPYGVSSGPEEYQARQQEALAGLRGICNIADDVLIYGCGQTQEEAERDHDQNLYNFLLRMRQVQLRLNPKKWRFKLPEVIFMGFLLSPKGVSPAPSMVEAITAMPEPTDPQGVQRFLGMLNFLSRFCPKLSDVVKPLRELTHKDTPFTWTETHSKAFKAANNLLTQAPTLRYFNPEQPVTLQVDASGVGVGGALLQEGQPVAFYSCTLTETEQRYAVIEKECLAICLSFEKWDSLLYGKSDITVESDHQPLEAIFKKALNKAPRRLQAMRMRLQRWSFKVKYRKVSLQVIADTLSRAPLPEVSTANLSGEHIFRVELERVTLENPGISKATLHSLQEQTAVDPALSRLIPVILTGWPANTAQLDPLVRPYHTFKEELTVANGVVYKGQKAVIPQSMRAAMLKKIHSTHFGVGSCTRRAKECLFWPGMTTDIKHTCASCSVCAQYASQAPREPMLSHEIPDTPWSVVSQDLLMWEGKWHLVMTCFYSDWVEIDVLPDTTTATIVKATKAHFARLGIPNRVITDNGPQYISDDFRQFASEYGFEHVTSSPYWSQGNGKAESAVKIVKRMYQKNTDIQAALLDYRNTPPGGMDHSPAQRLLCRRTRAFLPMTPTLLQPEIVDKTLVKEQLEARRARAKYYHDRGISDSPLEAIEPGQHVYVKPNPQHKHSAWPYGVVQKLTTPRSYTVLTPEGKEVRRNRVQVRLAAAPPPGQKTYLSEPDTICPQEPDTGDAEASLGDTAAAPAPLKPQPVGPGPSTPLTSSPPAGTAPKPHKDSPPQQGKQVVTRSGRVVKAPAILDL